MISSAGEIGQTLIWATSAVWKSRGENKTRIKDLCHTESGQWHLSG